MLPLAKTLTDTIKMIAYRAETALVGLLRPHLANEAEARALIRKLFVSSADLEPDDTAGTLTIRIHRMASPVHDRAITQLLATGRCLVLYPGSLELESAPNISPPHNLCQPAKPGTSLGTPAFAHSGWEKLTHAGVNHWANLALQSAQCIARLVNSPLCQSVTRVP